MERESRSRKRSFRCSSDGPRDGRTVKPGIHILRHTFCSHLSMRGAPARAIQELAGHQDLGTTQRYMHLSPAAIEGAIRLLDQPAPLFIPDTARGEMGEARVSSTANAHS